MENSVIIYKKSQSKDIVKNLSESARMAVDTIFAYAPQFEEAARAVKAAQKTITPVLCDNMSKIAADKEGIKKAGFENFTDLARKVFGFENMSIATISQAKRVGDLFFNVEKRPICADWFTISQLHELRKVSIETLDKSAESGELNENMTQAQLREYAKTHSTKQLTDGNDKPEIVNGYIYHDYQTGNILEAVTVAEIMKSVNGGEAPLADNVHTVKLSQTIIIPPTTNKGKEKKIPVYLIAIEDENANVRFCKYYEKATNLSKEERAKVAAFRKMAKSMNIDLSDKTDNDILEMSK